MVTVVKFYAKLRITALIIITMIMGAVLSGCERKDLYLRVDQAEINIAIYDIQLDLLWQPSWRLELDYEWLAKYGPLGYPEKPELVKGIIYDVDTIEHKRTSYFSSIFNSTGGRVSLKTRCTYNMMFYNFGTEWILFQQSEDYEYYNATTRTSSQTSWTRTASESEDSEMPEAHKSYIEVNQPDAIYGVLTDDLYVSDDPGEYEKEFNEDGRPVYIYKVDCVLDPYVFIYIFQFVVKNNVDEEGQIITGAHGITVTGLSQGVEMFSRKTFDNTISITTEDIKEMQHHKNITLEGDSAAFDGDIFVARMLTWGLPGINPMEKTLNNEPVEVIDNNYVGVGLKLRNGYTYTITRDITEQMHKRPTGGIITVVIDAGKVPEEYLEHKPETGGGGFNASVEDWENEIEAELVI